MEGCALLAFFALAFLLVCLLLACPPDDSNLSENTTTAKVQMDSNDKDAFIPHAMLFFCVFFASFGFSIQITGSLNATQRHSVCRN